MVNTLNHPLNINTEDGDAFSPSRIFIACDEGASSQQKRRLAMRAARQLGLSPDGLKSNRDMAEFWEASACYDLSDSWGFYYFVTEA